MFGTKFLFPLIKLVLQTQCGALIVVCLHGCDSCFVGSLFVCFLLTFLHFWSALKHLEAKLIQVDTSAGHALTW